MGRSFVVTSVNPAIIQWCCMEAGITLGEVASATKINISKLEKNSLTFMQLKKVANYFDYGISFFLSKKLPADNNSPSVAFRTHSNQAVTSNLEIHKLLRNIEYHREVYLELSNSEEKETSPKYPTLNGSISEKAQQLREWLSLDSNKKYDFDKYREIIEGKNILVFKSSGYSGSWKLKNSKLTGLLMYHKELPIILTKKTNPQREAFTLFHELGHFFLHKNSFVDDEDSLNGIYKAKIEREANQFAAWCLFPKEIASQDIFKTTNPAEYDERFKPIAKKLGISTEVIVTALLQRKIINNSDYIKYQSLKNEANKNIQTPDNKTNKNIPRVYRHREPCKIFGKNYTRVVIDSLHRKNITLSKTCAYLDNITVSDVKKLSSYLWES